MAAAKITIKNYRCFSDSSPAIVDIGGGFTALIGQNNSGKSSFLKLFFELHGLWSRLGPNSGNMINMLHGNAESISIRGVFDNTEIFCDANDRDMRISIDLTNLFPCSPRDGEITKVEFSCRRSDPASWFAEFFSGPGFQSLKTRRFGSFADNRYIVSDDAHARYDCAVFWELMSDLARIIYIGPFRNAINEGSGQYFDLAIGSSFISTWNNWKTGREKWQNTAIAQVTDDIRRIFEFERLEINASEALKTLQIIVGNKPYKLPELGAGISQFIIVLANVMMRKPSLVFIDEPELNLHPSLQMDFLTSLASYATKGVVFATHSIGLARATAERIYSFQRQSDVTVVRSFEQTPNYVEFLGEMSFSGFQDLGYERVLLVEGVTDVRTAQQFLRKLHKDHKTVVLPLGGNQLIRAEAASELGELRRLGARVAVLIDREDPETGATENRQAFAEKAKALGFDVCLTERRAIENYLSDRAIKMVKGPKYRALGSEERLSACPMGWSKSDNWRIAREMQWDEIASTDVGLFLGQL